MDDRRLDTRTGRPHHDVWRGDNGNSQRRRVPRTNPKTDHVALEYQGPHVERHMDCLAPKEIKARHYDKNFVSRTQMKRPDSPTGPLRAPSVCALSMSFSALSLIFMWRFEQRGGISCPLLRAPWPCTHPVNERPTCRLPAVLSGLSSSGLPVDIDAANRAAAYLRAGLTGCCPYSRQACWRFRLALARTSRLGQQDSIRYWVC